MWLSFIDTAAIASDALVRAKEAGEGEGEVDDGNDEEVEEDMGRRPAVKWCGGGRLVGSTPQSHEDGAVGEGCIARRRSGDGWGGQKISAVFCCVVPRVHGWRGSGKERFHKATSGKEPK